MIRVLHIECGTGRGGSARSLLALLPHLPAVGVDPVVAVYRAEAVALFAAAGVPVLDLSAAAGHARRVLAVRRALQTRGALLVHTNNDIHSHRDAIVAAWTAGIPAVAHVRAVRPLTRSERAAASLVGRVVAPSRAVSGSLLASGVPASRIDLVPNPVDLHPAPRASVTTRPRVVCLGSLRAAKGLGVLLDATGILVGRGLDVEVVVAGGPFPGEDGYGESLAAQAFGRGLSDRFRVVGHAVDPLEVLAGARVLAYPTLLQEGFGRGPLEAQAAGVPVVASAIGAVLEVVAHGETGLLVPPGDPRALADAIGRVLGDAALASRLVAAGREAARRHDSSRIAAETAAVFRAARLRPLARRTA